MIKYITDYQSTIQIHYKVHDLHLHEYLIIL